MNKVIFAALASSIIAMPAFASSFTGPRVEAHVGWEQVGLDTKVSDGVDTFKSEGSKSGVTYGIGAGYDFALSDNMIGGVEANFDWADTKKCGELYGLDQLCLKAQRDLDVSFRLGQKFGESALVYVKIGYANGKFKASYVDFENILPSTSDSDTRSGIRVGAGVEAALGGNAYIKGEYRYTDYKNWKYSEPGLGSVSAGFDRHQLVAGVGYRF